MADQQLTAGSELSVIVPEIWSRKYYDTLLQSNAFNSLISKDYEGEVSNLGDTIKISTIPEFDQAQDLPEGARSDAEAITVSQQNLVINKRFVKDFIVTKRGQMQSLPHMDKLRDLAIFSIEKAVNAEIIATTVPSASSPDHQIAYDSGSTLALADMLEAKELLDSADVPMSNRHLVVDSPQLNDLFNISGFTSSDFLLSGAPLQSGMVSSPLLGFMPSFTTSAAGVSYFFHNSYLTMASQQGMDVRQYDLGVDGNRGMRINVDNLVGFKQLGDDRVVTIS